MRSATGKLWPFDRFERNGHKRTLASGTRVALPQAEAVGRRSSDARGHARRRGSGERAWTVRCGEPQCRIGYREPRRVETVNGLSQL
jgi:hypothetical protein